MDIIKIIKTVYLSYTIYVLLLINTTSLKVINVVPAILLMWILFFVFGLGYRLKKRNHIRVPVDNNFSSWILKRNNLSLLLIATISIISAILAAYFYTGQTPLSTFKGLLGDSRSLYYEYQIYASLHERGVFKLTKIPFILMMFNIKFILFYSYVSFLIVKEKLTNFDKFYLFLITIPHIYFGFARGTNYELFELVMITIFVILSRIKRRKVIKVPIKSKLLIFFIVSIMVFLFYNRISARGVIFDYNISRDFRYDSEGVVPSISSFLSFIILLVYDYFGFGFFYVSKYITEIWFSSINFFFAGLIPFGYVAIENNNIQDIIHNYLNMGTRWHPDVILAINKFGLLGLLLICFILGIIAKYIFIQNRVSLMYLTQFMIFLQMISLPVGNFIFTSSANTLIVLLIIGIRIWERFIKKKVSI